MLDLHPPIESNGNASCYIHKNRPYMSYNVSIYFAPRFSSSQSLFSLYIESTMVFFPSYLFFLFPLSPFWHSQSLHLFSFNNTQLWKACSHRWPCFGFCDKTESPRLILKGSFLMNFAAYGFHAVLFFQCYNKCLSIRGICHWILDNALYSAVLCRFGVIQFCVCSINATVHFMLVIQSS